MNAERGQRYAVLKRVSADGFGIVGNAERNKRGAVLERGRADGFKSGRKRYIGKRGTAVKNGRRKNLHAFGNGDRGQSLAVQKRVASERF